MPEACQGRAAPFSIGSDLAARIHKVSATREELLGEGEEVLNGSRRRGCLAGVGLVGAACRCSFADGTRVPAWVIALGASRAPGFLGDAHVSFEVGASYSTFSARHPSAGGIPD